MRFTLKNVLLFFLFLCMIIEVILGIVCAMIGNYLWLAIIIVTLMYMTNSLKEILRN